MELFSTNRWRYFYLVITAAAIQGVANAATTPAATTAAETTTDQTTTAAVQTTATADQSTVTAATDVQTRATTDRSATEPTATVAQATATTDQTTVGTNPTKETENETPTTAGTTTTGGNNPTTITDETTVGTTTDAMTGSQSTTEAGDDSTPQQLTCFTCTGNETINACSDQDPDVHSSSVCPPGNKCWKTESDEDGDGEFVIVKRECRADQCSAQTCFYVTDGVQECCCTENFCNDAAFVSPSLINTMICAIMVGLLHILCLLMKA